MEIPEGSTHLQHFNEKTYYNHLSFFYLQMGGTLNSGSS